jgi:hypothetical protein
VHLNSIKNSLRNALVVALVAVVSGCTGDDAIAPKPAPLQPTISAHNRVKFKGGRRFVADIAQGLALDPKQVCLELSTVECEKLNRIPLGGIEPYQSGIYQALPERTAASTNAVDRIALSACEERAKRDFAQPQAAQVFGDIVAANPSKEARQAVAKKLYSRLLHRDPTVVEVDAMLAFYIELEATEGPKVNRLFATYACYAVATLEESVFY